MIVEAVDLAEIVAKHTSGKGKVQAILSVLLGMLRCREPPGPPVQQEGNPKHPAAKPHSLQQVISRILFG